MFIKNKDCLQEALETEGEVGLLIFASHKRYGGGYKNHSKAQEEYIFNRTDLPSKYNDLIAKYYPFNPTDTKGFVVNGNYAGKDINFIFIPALVWNKYSNQEYILEERVKWIMSLPYKTLILGPWGCGVFNCPKDFIIDLFDKHSPINKNIIYCQID